MTTQLGGGLWLTSGDGQRHRGDGITTATVMSATTLLAVDPVRYKTAIKGTHGFVLAEVRVDVDAASVKKGLDYLEGCIAEDGGMAYSAVNGATGPQCAGRACGALLAFHLHGRTSPKIERLQTYALAHYEDVLESHPAPLTGVLFATMLAGCWQRDGHPAY